MTTPATAPGYHLSIITEPDGTAARVGEQGRDYRDCFAHARLITAALHDTGYRRHRTRSLDGALLGIGGVGIHQDSRDDRCVPLSGRLLPGDRFVTGWAAVDAVAAHLGAQAPPEVDAGAWHRLCVELLVAAGAIAEADGGGYLLVRMPRHADLPRFVVDEGHEILQETRNLLQ